MSRLEKKVHAWLLVVAVAGFLLAACVPDDPTRYPENQTTRGASNYQTVNGTWVEEWVDGHGRLCTGSLNGRALDCDFIPERDETRVELPIGAVSSDSIGVVSSEMEPLADSLRAFEGVEADVELESKLQEIRDLVRRRVQP